MPENSPDKAELLARRPRSRRVFSPDDMKRLHALYYNPAVSVTEAAAAFGVPGSTLLRWIAEMGWPRRGAARNPARAPEGAKVDSLAFRMDAGIAAREKLRLARLAGGGRSLEERARSAAVIASLTRSIQRIDDSIAIHAYAEALRKELRKQYPPEIDFIDFRRVINDLKEGAVLSRMEILNAPKRRRR